MSDIVERITEVFTAAGARGFVHAREVGVAGGAEVSVGADEPVVLASVFKIPVAVAYAREVAAGRLDETERTVVTARYRIGGIGTAGSADDVEMSWRDLARFMMIMSDNAATDVIYQRVGQAAIDAVLSDLDLRRTRLIGDCQGLFDSAYAELDMDGLDLEQGFAQLPPELVWKLSIVDPERTTSSIPREITALLDAVWTDHAGPPEACERVRKIMAEQIWPHRLTSGFASEVKLAAKTGTLPAVRNEAGVITYPDGRRYAVAVFTRAHTLDERLPAVDASIGRAARLAVDHLRAG
ncbi:MULTISPECIES: serine hydrolase [unclassified Crossiella]|uniref:serine hydrolase n=1 Tax=unclassified Crossiella TaxID=2620835 RepID=UPI001FFF6946|nr:MULTISPECIES: serine hydrolase [unclassified Crossiella]MCK2239081.1 class A beta-lactamase-related serine hydrolase [Crossiella sp. S99.2]MCK2251350.1 class A beta-lactamase-related serine hydrolase [Crossiella sp. S99.1]